MNKVMHRTAMFVIKAGITAVLTKVAMDAIKKLREPSTTEKIDEMIDEKAEKAKELAKAGAHKSIGALDQIATNVEESDLRDKVSSLGTDMKFLNRN